MATKEVRFDLYCKDCVHLSKREGEDPCNDCLGQGWNEDSHKPIHFKERVTTDGQQKRRTQTPRNT